jgi:8-oxo-dGTP pyrophosphatase MutT (NUDIX family)
MLHLTPALFHRGLLRLAHGVRVYWWRIARPRIVGACVIALDDAGHLLLLRQSYGTTQWVLPGGGVGRDEDPARAARREFEEEAGCAIADLAFAATSTESLHGATNDVMVFTARLAGEPRADGREIVEVRLFPLHDLPPEISPRVLARLELAGLAISR